MALFSLVGFQFALQCLLFSSFCWYAMQCVLIFIFEFVSMFVCWFAISVFLTDFTFAWSWHLTSDNHKAFAVWHIKRTFNIKQLGNNCYFLLISNKFSLRNRSNSKKYFFTSKVTSNWNSSKFHEISRNMMTSLKNSRDLRYHFDLFWNYLWWVRYLSSLKWIGQVLL